MESQEVDPSDLVGYALGAVCVGGVALCLLGLVMAVLGRRHAGWVIVAGLIGFVGVGGLAYGYAMWVGA